MNLRGSARGRARVYQAGGDMSFSGTHHHQHQHDYDLDPTGMHALFLGKGPGRLLMVVGLLVAMTSFVGWVSIIFRAAAAGVAGFGFDGLGSFFGAILPSGVPVGLVYFIGFGVGVVLTAVGASMAKAGAKGANPARHLLVTVVIIALAAFGLVQVLAGAPITVLVPHFTPDAQVAPAVVVSDKAASASRGGVTMTITGIENQGRGGLVHLRVVNQSARTVVLPRPSFVLTDAQGTTYQAKWFDGEWREQIGPGATQVGTIVLAKAVGLGRGPLRAEFTEVFGDAGLDSIAVTNITSR
jgi:hypothetical protein